MAIGGTINGREINWFAINAGVNVWDLDVNMSVALNQTLSLLTRTRLLVPYAIATFTQALSPLTRAKLIATDEVVIVNQDLDRVIKTQVLEPAGDIEFDTDVDLQLAPAMFVDHKITFAPVCEIDHVFYGHWLDGLRMVVHAQDRTIHVPEETRRIIVPPDDDELVEQKNRGIFA